jgi:3-hydroxyacyl-CoA dehydrogenase / enoyl-CoA hydratase / 3-hydroxybutyryl-CoA epimerase
MSQIFQIQIDGDGVALVTIDAPGRSMNVIGDAFLAEFGQVVERLATDPDICGAVLTSGKAAFLGGADLVYVESRARAALTSSEAPLPDFREMNRLQRRLETCGKPVAAALNGTALGGGYELALACHQRFAADDDRIRLGLPEVTVGLLPGGGGTQRLLRLIGVEAALPLLMQGAAMAPREALAAGLVDAVLPAGDLIAAASTWVRNAGQGVQPWDRPGFSPPGGTPATNPRLAALIMNQIAAIQRQGARNRPAPLAILSCVYEGSLLPLDAALGVESGYFAQLFRSPVAANVIRTNFINKGALDKLVHRPEGYARATVRRLGVLGAGMMGAGIAYAAAAVGIEVVLLDRTVEAAERGKAYSQTVLGPMLASARRTPAEAARLLDLIRPTADYADLAGCDFIVEAVCEDRAIKADVTRATAAVVQPGVVFGSNTSTLPITGLADAWPDPARFIGIHFFSPVDRMQLVEIIRGEKTSDGTLARTFDFVRQIRKTPILVNDHRGFYTSRVFGTYLDEGMKMVLEGIAPALIENAGRSSGMPVGPLTLQDEVSFELSYVVRNQTRDDLGAQYIPKMAEPIIDLFYEKLGRLGKKSGAGFYDYPAGAPKRLWPGLAEHFPVGDEQPEVTELEKRFLYIQALETARCLEEGVLVSPIDGDVGGVLGWSFAAHTGGPLSMIDTIGAEAFVLECQRMAQQYGARFRPPDLLIDMAERGRRFYEAA